ncbi:MAG TPA: serine/threonine-protein kinase [Candidatus Thermoplasmatota archaeon]|nr:serine/threonine-protein kinase [Candidatus Thermoplasmatota archaeon]
MAARVPLHQRDPEYRVLRVPRWSREGDAIVVDDAQTGIAQRWKPWTAEVLEGLAAAEPYPALVDRLQRFWPRKRRAWCDATLRRFLFTLHRLKAIELVLEQPTSFADGRYVVRKELGRGGVGVAWLCRDARDGREVVVKRAWDYFATLARADALMRAEAEVMRKLDHPRIAKALDAFEEDGAFHLVRELAEGEELSRWRGKGIEDVDARHRLADDIADIVAHLHERGFLLLDLRPANFFVDPRSMRPMLIDVGHCKPLANGRVELGKPAKNRAHGSPGFAAPETHDGVATPRTDVWGFGRLHFFVATGQLPKPTDAAADLLARLDAARVPESDRRLVARCAADAPEERPATMLEARALLRGGG